MPQMSPMWWTTIMIFSITMMYLSMNMIFFNYENKNMKKKKMTKNSMNWKW